MAIMQHPSRRCSMPPEEHAGMGWLHEAQNAAQKVLDENCITEPPVRILDLMDYYNLDVVTATFIPPDDNISGYIHPDGRRVFINRADSTEHQRFTLAHELGHVLMHKAILVNDPNIGIFKRSPLNRADKPIHEKQADAFAAHLLIPTSILKNYSHLDTDTLARLFAVSYQAMSWRRKNEKL